MNAFEKEWTESETEEYINECYDTVIVCGFEYEQGTILKEVDPIAFRCAVADMPPRWICDHCEDEYDDEEDAEECCDEYREEE